MRALAIVAYLTLFTPVLLMWGGPADLVRPQPPDLESWPPRPQCQPTGGIYSLPVLRRYASELEAFNRQIIEYGKRMAKYDESISKYDSALRYRAQQGLYSWVDYENEKSWIANQRNWYRSKDIIRRGHEDFYKTSNAWVRDEIAECLISSTKRCETFGAN